jgi:hypothetical protein
MNGFQQEMLIGRGLLIVEWYNSLRELVRGLMKNMFAGVGYSFLLVIISTVLLLAPHILPIAALFFTHDLTLWLNVAGVIVFLCSYAYVMRYLGPNPWHALAFPIASVFFVYLLWRAMVLNTLSGGITWRGTHYKLTKLRSNRV